MGFCTTARHPENSNHLLPMSSSGGEAKLSTNTKRGRDTNIVFLPLLASSRDQGDLEGSETETSGSAMTPPQCTNKYIFTEKKCASGATSACDRSEGKVEEEDNNNNNLHGWIQEGGLDSMDSLRIFLPIKRGLSRYFNGKSQSFSSLSKVDSVKDLAKPGYATRHAKRLKHISTDCSLQRF